MKHNDTGFILVPADGAVRTAERASTVLSCTGVLVVGGKSLGERGREAPKSLCTRGMIEESANTTKNELESVCVGESDPSGKRPASSFYRLKEGRLHVRGVPDVAILSPNREGVQLVAPVVEHYEAWPRAWPYSLEAFSHALNVYLSCGVRRRRGDSYRARRPLRLTG